MQTIVIGSLNTDLVATGIKQFPKPGEHVYGKELLIGAGGKSRNIADMIAHLTPENTVAMVGRTVKDPYGLWKLPMDALAKSTVSTDYVNVLEYEEANKLPGIALIPETSKAIIRYLYCQVSAMTLAQPTLTTQYHFLKL